jgi:hypothetical protein
MASFARYFDAASVLVIVITILLFVVALLFKGLTHDILLEAGVLLVSIKLILVAYKNSVFMYSTKKQLDDIQALLQRLESRGLPNRG